MAHIHVPAEVSVRYLPRSRKANLLILAFIVVGVVSFYMRWTQDAQADHESEMELVHASC